MVELALDSPTSRDRYATPMLIATFALGCAFTSILRPQPDVPASASDSYTMQYGGETGCLADTGFAVAAGAQIAEVDQNLIVNSVGQSALQFSFDQDFALNPEGTFTVDFVKQHCS